MSDDLGVVKIYRYDPAVDAEPYYQTFEGVPYQGRTVMDVLRDLFETQDGSVAFRCACRAGLCTVCRMRMNGSPVMACMKLAEKEMTLEPVKNQEIVRDLVTTFAKSRDGGSEDGGSEDDDASSREGEI